MKRKIVMCLALSALLSTVSFAELQKIESNDSSKIYEQKHTYKSSAKDSTYLYLPTYLVNLNGENMDNEHLEYPFLTYKSITYMPLTYNLTRCLGIETSWTAETGLAVDFTNISSEYDPQLKKTQNAKRVKVQVPKYQISVNGTVLSADDAYPCFVYNNVVYLPLTSALVENELNAKIKYDAKTGLSITSMNPIVKRYEEVSQNLNTTDWQRFAQVYEGNIYYTDTQNRIMVQSVDSSVEPKAFVALNEEISTLQDDHFFSSLVVKDNSVLLTCHVGGAMMGSDLVFKLFEDGTYTLISSSYDIVVQFEDFDIKYWGGPMGGGPLYIRSEKDGKAKTGVNSMSDGDEQYKAFGAEGVMFGWHWYKHNNGSSGGGPSGPVILRGDDLYLLGYDTVKSDHTRIYKVNYKTNESEGFIERDVITFMAVGDDFYYNSSVTELTDAFYHYNINTQKDELIYQSDGYLHDYAFLGKHLYFVDDQQRFKMVLDENKSQPLPSTESTICEGLKLFDAGEPYLVSVFTETADSKYRIIVFNKEEEIVFKTSDHSKLDSITIDGDLLYYINDASGDLCSVNLKAVQ